MKSFGWNSAILGITALSLAASLTACEDSGGSGGGSLGDVGSNNPDTYACNGDSITGGGNGGGDPYPPRLEAITGKSVANYGVDSETTGSALGKIASILASEKPAALLIDLGAVDLIEGTSLDTSIENLRNIIEQAKANDTVPVVATLTPMTGAHALWADGAKALSALIRTLASEEGARLVDLEKEFGDGDGLLLDDGLHPNETGNQLMAEAFADAL